jgi:hypothetical protein
MTSVSKLATVTFIMWFLVRIGFSPTSVARPAQPLKSSNDSLALAFAFFQQRLPQLSF